MVDLSADLRLVLVHLVPSPLQIPNNRNSAHPLSALNSIGEDGYSPSRSPATSNLPDLENVTAVCIRRRKDPLHNPLILAREIPSPNQANKASIVKASAASEQCRDTLT